MSYIQYRQTLPEVISDHTAPLSGATMMTLRSLVEISKRTDERLIDFMRSHGATIARMSIGLVFIWFGLLKVIGTSPVAALVEQLFPWIPASISLPAIGIFEVALGVAFMTGFALRITLALFWLHMAGTFLVPVLQPDLAFQGGNLLYLTATGEFVIKNLVLISAGLVIGGTLKKANEKQFSHSNTALSATKL